MKIPVGGDSYLEPDEGARDSRFHVGIVSIERIPNTRVGCRVTLTCGHVVMTFGDLQAAQGRVLCTVCRDKAAG